jgi:1,4-alpha-glucan branching enzyme
MWGYPGKKLLFMGQEFAQRMEWSESKALDWHLLKAPAHEGVRRLVRDLNFLYREKPALHARDCEAEGFSWAIVDDRVNSVFAWIRRAPGAPPVVVIANMTPVTRSDYRVPLPADGTWKEMVNSDALHYGGSGVGNMGAVSCISGMATLTLPPLATIMLEHSG